MTSPYVPGTEETDPKKQNMSLQALGAAISTNTANIATLQAGPLVAGAVAAKSDQTTGTSATLAVTPSTQQFHASAAKAWVVFDGKTGATATVKTSFNVTSVSRSGTGAYVITFATAFTSANYVFHYSWSDPGVNLQGPIFISASGNIAAGTFTFEARNFSNVAADFPIITFAFFGIQ